MFSVRCLKGAAALVAAAVPLLAPLSSQAQTIAPQYTGSYSLVSLGLPTGVPISLGGLTLQSGNPNRLLIGGNANGTNGGIYAVDVVRGAGNHITGFSGAATLFASAPNIDGGLAYGPNGVLFATGYPNNTLLQYLPGATTPSKTITLPASIASSVGALGFVPTGLPGAGSLKIISYNGGTFYDVGLVADGTGTYNLGTVTQTATGLSGPEGLVYVPTGSSLFSSSAMLVSEYGAGRVSAFDVDASGNPLVGTRREFITDLTGAEGAFIDPLTGDFLFSTFGGGNQVVAVRGFAVSAAPEPASLGLLAGGTLPLVGAVRAARRRRK